jgi:hypothetical protein
MGCEVKIVDELLEEGAARAAREILAPLPRIPHGLFWMDLERVRRFAAGAEGEAKVLDDYFGPELSRFLFRFFARLIEQLGDDRLRAIDFWVRNINTTLGKVNLHLDTYRGEKSAGATRFPVWSTSYFLGPLAPGMVGGELALSTERPLPAAILAHDHQYVEEAEAWSLLAGWMTVPCRFNRLVAFSGDTPHFVVPIRRFPDDDGHRISLLVNLWQERPQFSSMYQDGYCQMSPAEFRVFLKLKSAEFPALKQSLARLSGEEAAALKGIFDKIGRVSDS